MEIALKQRWTNWEEDDEIMSGMRGDADAQILGQESERRAIKYKGEKRRQRTRVG